MLFSSSDMPGVNKKPFVLFRTESFRTQIDSIHFENLLLVMRSFRTNGMFLLTQTDTGQVKIQLTPESLCLLKTQVEDILLTSLEKCLIMLPILIKTFLRFSG